METGFREENLFWDTMPRQVENMCDALGKHQFGLPHEVQIALWKVCGGEREKTERGKEKQTRYR